MTPVRTLTAGLIATLAACDVGQTESEIQVGETEVEIERDARDGEVEDIDVESVVGYDWGYGASWTAWDTDANRVVDWDEYLHGWKRVGVFTAWDANDDGNVSDEEAGLGLFADWDQNHDDELNVDELRWGLRGWSKEPMSWGRFGLWDGDGDGVVTEGEFLARWKALSVYEAQWDTDGSELVDEQELALGVFAMWDLDGDKTIDAVEYRF